MRRAIQFIAIAVLLASCLETPPSNFVVLKKDFVAYKTAHFYFEKDVDYKEIKIDCDCNYHFTDSMVFIISKYGVPVVMTMGEHAQIFLPDSNAAFNPDWKNLPLGENPTPLTQKQAGAYRNYMAMRMLNVQAPSFAIENELSQNDLLGKVTVINFWYKGCVPCMEEIPALNSVKEHYARNNDVQFWAFSADKELKGHENYHFDHFLASKEVRSKFAVMAFPTTFIVDKRGVIRVANLGAQEGKNESIVTNLKYQIGRLLDRKVEVLKD